MIWLLFSSLIATIAASCNETVLLTTVPTTITSPGYPGDYPPYQNCWWKLTTTFRDSAITLEFEDLIMEADAACRYDALEIFAGPSRTSPFIGKYCGQNQKRTTNSNTSSLYLWFHSDGSNQFKGFRVKAYETYGAKHQLIQNAVKLDCTSTGWLTELNTTTLALVMPEMDTNNIYMSNQFCTGHMNGELLIFNSSYADCNTGVKDSRNSLIMSNYLVEYMRDNQTQLVTGSKWRYDLSCYLHKNETDHLSFVPVDNNTLVLKATGVVPTNQAVIKFFSDAGYTNPMTANPLKVSLGTRVYVQVEEPYLPDDIKLILNSCDVTGDRNDANSVALIRNRCEANHFTHILGSIPRLARFYFDVFETRHLHQNLYVNCDVTFCPMLDFSPKCQNTCQKTNP